MDRFLTSDNICFKLSHDIELRDINDVFFEIVEMVLSDSLLKLVDDLVNTTGCTFVYVPTFLKKIKYTQTLMNDEETFKNVPCQKITEMIIGNKRLVNKEMILFVSVKFTSNKGKYHLVISPESQHIKSIID